MERLFVLQKDRFCIGRPDTYVLQGYFQGNSIAGNKLRVFLDKEELPVQTEVLDGPSIRQKYMDQAQLAGYIDREYIFRIALPENFAGARELKVVQYQGEKRKCVHRIRTRRLKKRQRELDTYLESVRTENGRLLISGWAAGAGAVRAQVRTQKGKKLFCEERWFGREDVRGGYGEQERELLGADCGFEISVPDPGAERLRLILSAGGQKKEYRLSTGNVGKQGSAPSYARKAAAYFKRNGFWPTVRRCLEKLSQAGGLGEESYDRWRKKRLPSPEELERQRKTLLSGQPLISIVVPLYRTPLPFLKELVASVEAQTYANWELCFSDGSGADSPLTGYLEELMEKEPRIRVTAAQKQLGISENTNEALKLARGDFIAFADHDDLLAPEALFTCVTAILEQPDTDLIYSDEDKVSMNGKEYFQPHFKPDFNIDLLRSMNYFCHLVLVKRTLLEKAGGQLDPACDGAQDYDLVLRCAEKAEGIRHIPRVLYHWRAHRDSTAENPESKRYAFEAGCRAVQAHLDRCGIDARVTEGEYPGLYRVHYAIPREQPLVSVIIPNKDHTEDLDKCLASILKKSSYQNLEFVIVENNSTQKETFAYYDRIQQEHGNVRVLYWKEEFNYSGINNFGAANARGEYLLLLNNDTEMIGENAIEELLGPCLRPDVGIVGARLYYPDDTIQHAGVIVGFGGVAGHAFIGSRRGDNGYFSRIICQADLSAVTAACMMVKRSVFEEAHGLDPEFQVAFNDIDFCLRVRSLGQLVVYNPFAEFYHYESKSRGYEDTPEKIERFNRESARFAGRWEELLKKGDPYYNPNLTLSKADFSLRP